MEPQTHVDPQTRRDALAAASAVLNRLVGRADRRAVETGRAAAGRGDVEAVVRLLLQLSGGGARVQLMPDEHETVVVLADEILDLPDLVLPEPLQTPVRTCLRCRPGGSAPDGPAIAAVLQAVARLTGVVGVWQADAEPLWGGPWPTVAPFLVVEVGDDADEEEVTEALSLAVADADDPQGPPHLAVVGPSGPETPEASSAQLNGRLLWASRPDQELRLAQLFPAGQPQTEHGLPISMGSEGGLSGDEAAAVAEYLTGAEMVLEADHRGTDVVTGQVETVPLDLRSDGSWIWSDATCYYLRRYGLQIDTGLADHVLHRIGSNDLARRPRPLDGVDHHRILAVLGSAEEAAG